MNILIIEDEIRTANELEKILLSIDPTIHILDKIDSIEASIAYLENNDHPDLIFADIQLADGMSFEIFQSIEVKSPIIFCTAFDEYMTEAFDTNAISYILKPVNKEKVSAALQKFQNLRIAFEPVKAAQNIANATRQLKLTYKTTLLVEHRQNIIPLPVSEIAFLYLDKTIIKITTFNNQTYHLTSSMDELEKNIDPEVFYRANRQFLINKKSIANIERFFTRKLAAKLIVSTPETVVVSKAKASEFLRWIEGQV